MSMGYKAGTDSSIGANINTWYHYRKALIDLKKEQYFGQLADVRAMPKHFGKTIKQFHYLPLLDDRNVNDQGLDASGAVIADGNLYGSSKDIGTITGKLPTLTENGGRVNRVGYKRLTIEATLAKLGFFDEYTKESIDFDNENDLFAHISRESLRGANEITEDVLQIDLLNGAGVIYYGGDATTVAEVTGANGDTASVLSYELLMKMDIELDNNRCPKSTTIITGSKMTDTKTVNSARYLYVGSELIPTIKRMKDLHNNQAFIPVQQYADAGTVAKGELGSIDNFRIIVAPEMAHWAGAGKAEGTNDGYSATSGNYDVFPAMVVGSGSFTTIGFQTSGKSVKFKIKHAAPESPEAYANDPYGETGFHSIKWYYATMILRPEWIAVAKVVAEL